MKYTSTRNKNISIDSAEAIKQGLSKDGGLFVPVNIEAFTQEDFIRLSKLSYNDIAFEVMSKYLTDFSKDELTDCINSSYNADKFSSSDITPIAKLNDHCYILELFHGPTCAFKDVALQILPKYLTYSMKKTGEKRTVVILVATSGDTGKAALEGFSDVDGTKIIVFYPDDGVSNIQKLQMVTQDGKNVMVGAVKGNFDAAQNGVKSIFTDKEFEKCLADKGFVLSSANSINWGRLLPQFVYYIYSFCNLIKNKKIKPGEKINICVPTGNFGNILAAYYAMKMGLPVNKLICASNSNNVLTDFIKTGIYNKNRNFFATISPSMDILISSNLERLLFNLSDNNDVLINELMGKLNSKGEYQIDEKIKEKINTLFYGGFLSDKDTKKIIKNTFEKYSYMCDTHTAVALGVYEEYVKNTNDKTVTVIASTASPYKFSQSVLEAFDLYDEKYDDFELLQKLYEISKTYIPKSLLELKDKTVRFKDKIDKDNMKEFVNNYLK
jgi:threonine synthase